MPRLRPSPTLASQAPDRFGARKLNREVNAFGLGFLYEVEFHNEDRTVVHSYLRDGRFVTRNGLTQRIPIAGPDARLQAPNDEAFLKACFDHVTQFDLVANAPDVPNGDLDLSRFRPPPAEVP